MFGGLGQAMAAASQRRMQELNEQQVRAFEAARIRRDWIASLPRVKGESIVPKVKRKADD